MFGSRKLSLILSSLGAALCLMGCPSADVVSESRCDAARRCASGAAEVCGEDGKTYACSALARCEGVIVDPSGQACVIDGPDMSGEADMCQPVLCRIDCAQGFKTNSDGCEICACEEINCPPVAPPDCRPGERIVCDADDVCGTSCVCEQAECPIIDYAACPPGSISVCEDQDGDGCEECRCDSVVCPPDDGTCDSESERVCEDLDGDGCEECRCEEIKDCPAPPLPQCPPNTTPVLTGEPCGQWSCEPAGCPSSVDCDTFDETVTCAESDEDQECDSCWCESVSCPGANRPKCEGDETITGVDDRGCAVFVCEDAPTCGPVLCGLACEFGFSRGEDGCEECACAEPSLCYFNGDCEFDELCLNEDGEQRCPWGDDECRNGPVCDGPGCTGICRVAPRCSLQEPCAQGQDCQEIFRDDCCPGDAFCVEGIPSCLNQCVNVGP